MRRQAQPTPHDELHKFEVRLIVAGSRGFDDYELFSQLVFQHEASFAGKSLIYISGKASSGADAMIIRWCKENGRPWSEFPADWDDVSSPDALPRTNRAGKIYNALAGFQRNTRMAEVGTDLLTFYDGFSRGTPHMIGALARKCGNEHVKTVLINLNSDRGE